MISIRHRCYFGKWESNANTGVFRVREKKKHALPLCSSTIGCNIPEFIPHVVWRKGDYMPKTVTSPRHLGDLFYRLRDRLHRGLIKQTTAKLGLIANLRTMQWLIATTVYSNQCVVIWCCSNFLSNGTWLLYIYFLISICFILNGRTQNNRSDMRHIHLHKGHSLV